MQAQVARYFGATPVNATPAPLLGQAACRALHADAPGPFLQAHRVPPHAGRELRRRTASASRSRAGSRPGTTAQRRDPPAHTSWRMRHPRLRLPSMSPTRVALLALCTLLVGAGIGYGATQPRRLGRRSAAAPSPSRPRLPRARRRRARPRARRLRDSRPASRTRRSAATSASFRAIVDAQNPGVALDDLDALYKTDAYVQRTCHPLAHEIGHLAYAKYKSVTAAEALRARDLLVGLPPRPHGELHLAVRRQAAAHEDERHLQAGRRPTPTRSPTTTAGTGSATGSRSASRRTSSTRCASAT